MVTLKLHYTKFNFAQVLLDKAFNTNTKTALVFSLSLRVHVKLVSKT